MGAKIEMLNEDCMDVMARYPDGYFDLAIVDPPYGIGSDSCTIKPATVLQKNGNRLPVKISKYEKKNWDKIRPEPKYFNGLKRVSIQQIIWGANYFSFDLSGGRIVWSKLNGLTDQCDCEVAYFSGNRRTDLVYYMWNGMLQGERCSRDIRKAFRQKGNKNYNEARIHPTQKPVALYKWLLKNYAKPGDKILDTHGGSGSIAIACHYMGFDLVWTEIDKDYYKAAVERFERETRQLDFGV